MGEKYKIPSSVASKLEQIKLYMGMHSVTAFVGSGFSLNAEIPSHVKMKTWNQLRETFLEKLYPNNEEDKSRDANDIVRLSSLVDAEFGHNELDNMLEEALPDALVRPGMLHRMLVQLPWKDILTTNYDTLIERAASQVINDLKVVTNKETLLYQSSPRIIKLHGSFPNVRPYIMTQEDFRRYPIERPEMVNTAKQCFLESLVCLIGFSGEDPNFRAWIGWLKDVIGQKRLCPTYLITYRKGFHDAEKALLSHMGVDIINLADVEGVDSYYSAYEFFLSYLQESPTKWNGAVDINHITEDNQDEEAFSLYITQKVEEMRKVRETYPGWLILPKSHEKEFECMNREIGLLERCYKRIDDEKLKLSFLYEVNWRLRIAAIPQKLDWIAEAIETHVARIASMDGTEKKMMSSLFLTLLDILRYANDNVNFKKYCNMLLVRNDLVPTRHVYYQQVLYWLVRYNHPKVKEILSKWEVEISDYQNCLQKANILYYIGERLDAFKLLVDCKESILKSLLQNKNNIYAKSCLTYILKTMSWCDDGKKSQDENLFKFATGESFEDITDRLCGKAYENIPIQGFAREHLFEIGHYVNNWNMGPSGFVHDFLYPYKWWMLKERIGVSMFMINNSYTKYCIQKMFDFSWEMAWNMMMLSANGKLVNEVFGREQLSHITDKEADAYFDIYIELFERTDKIGNDWVGDKILNVLPVVLGRLCTKVSTDRILRFVNAALKWPSHIINKSLNGVYDNLTNDDLGKVWNLLLPNKKIKTDYDNGYRVPDRYMVKFAVTEEIKKRVLAGFESTDKGTVLQSIVVAEILLVREDITEQEKTVIKDAIRRMRSGASAIAESIYTYSYIDLGEQEKSAFYDKLNADVKTFCETEYLFDQTSEPFSQWNRLFERIYVLRKFLSEDQKKLVLLHNADLVEKNRSSFEKDDSHDFFGGMRHFTEQIVGKIKSFFLCMTLDGWSDEEIQKILAQAEWLISKGFHCLPMKVKVSCKVQQVDNDIVNLIKSALFSKDPTIQTEGVQAFFVLKDNDKDVESILNYILANFIFADACLYKELLILLANLITRQYNKDNFYNRVIGFLETIHRDYCNYHLDITSLSDLQFYANYVAGVLSVQMPNENIPIFTKEETGFNDVFVGFDKGVEMAHHKNV